MILRSLFTNQIGPAADDNPPVPMFQAFLETQNHVASPYTMLFQAEHARLSGALAAALSPEAFGPLPPAVVEAIGSHDAGWEESDREQLERAAIASPRPFPALGTEETLPSWERTIGRAFERGELPGILVSRHFGFVGSTEPDRAEFLEGERHRREAVEARLSVPEKNLERWTAAMGFCDVLSLYLCSGCRQPAELPFAHPASPQAKDADRVTLFWQGEEPCFSKPLIEAGTRFTATGYRFDANQKIAKEIAFGWLWS